MQTHHRRNHGDKHQRDDDHAQQCDIYIAGQIRPGEGGADFIDIAAMNDLQEQTKHHTHGKRNEDLFGKTGIGSAQFVQGVQQGDEDCDTEHV